ncbi:MAG: GxxExxY protein [Candidatus Parabeggiatoa sp.]|nr:GxxExxY protein [Candidatus Parabeggiatoa sp.]
MYNNLTYQINGCLFTVYNQLKNIWNEKVYEEALRLELQSQGLKAETQKEFEVFYFDKRVGLYYLDILVEDIIIVELKAVHEVVALHKAQLISYLKGYNKPVGILANFGEKSLYYQTFPNKFAQKTPLTDTFDFSKVQFKGKEEFKDLLLIANRILVTLGTGYFPQIYRRAFYYELESAKIQFEVIKKLIATYRNHALAPKEVNFFILGDLLLSVVTVKTLNPLTLSRFAYHMRYLNCKRGLIFNFNAVCLDYRYLENP